jgi:hypothetical protein
MYLAFYPTNISLRYGNTASFAGGFQYISGLDIGYNYIFSFTQFL